MSSVNKAIIIGNLGADPEIRYMPSGEPVANFSVATSETWKDKQTGEKKERTEWHKVSFFGKVAEICGEYLRKGSKVYVEGSLQTRKWQDKSGVDRYTTEIKGRDMRMLGGKQDGESSASRPAQAAGRPQPAPAGDTDLDDDIPF